MNGLTQSELIELKWISRAINEMLGTDFKVFTNARTEIIEGDFTEVLLTAERIPFAITGINSENLYLTLEVLAKANNEEQRNLTLKKLNSIIGHKDGVIKTDTGKSYNFASFLDFQKPSGAPYIDNGGFKQILNVSGTMLVTDAETGAVISNFVATKLTFDIDGEVVSGFIPTLQVDTSLNFATETSPTGNNNTLSVQHTSRGICRVVSGILLNRPIDDAILRLINEIGEGIELNESVLVERVYPRTTFSSVNRIIGAELSEPAGAYMQYRLTLQGVTD